MPSTQKIKPVSKFSADEAEMVRIAAHTQLRVLRTKCRKAREATKVDPAEVAFYWDAITRWEKFVEKLDRPYDDAAYADKSQNSWKDEENEDDEEDDGLL